MELIDASALGVIHVEGDDARGFLQGQATPDLRNLEPGDAVFGGFCNAQGRVIANGWFQSIDKGVRIIVSADLIEGLVKRLRLYVLRSKVTITDLSEGSSLWMAYAAAPEHRDEIKRLTHMRDATGNTAWSFLDRSDVMIASLPSGAFTGEIRKLFGNAFDLTMIQASIPLVTAITSEKYIPHMLGMNRIPGALSFDKGCYTGQEIVTRTQFLGKVKRSLYRIAADTTASLSAGQQVMARTSEESVGEALLTASLPSGGCVALAVMRNDLEAGLELIIDGHRLDYSRTLGDP